MVFEAELLCSPRASGRQVLSLVLLEASQSVEVLHCPRRRLWNRRGRSAIHRLEVVPVDAHIDLY